MDEKDSNKEQLSIAALKANLHYYAAKKEAAFYAHKKAIIEEHEALTALNNALRRIPF